MLSRINESVFWRSMWAPFHLHNELTFITWQCCSRLRGTENGQCPSCQETQSTHGSWRVNRQSEHRVSPLRRVILRVLGKEGRVVSACRTQQGFPEEVTSTGPCKGSEQAPPRCTASACEWFWAEGNLDPVLPRETFTSPLKHLNLGPCP